MQGIEHKVLSKKQICQYKSFPFTNTSIVICKIIVGTGKALLCKGAVSEADWGIRCNTIPPSALRAATSLCTREALHPCRKGERYTMKATGIVRRVEARVIITQKCL